MLKVGSLIIFFRFKINVILLKFVCSGCIVMFQNVIPELLISFNVIVYKLFVICLSIFKKCSVLMSIMAEKNDSL